MNTRLFTALAAASILAISASAAHADMTACKTSLTSSGDWKTTGMRFEASDTIPGVAPVDAYNRIYRAVSTQSLLFRVTNSDRDALAISMIEDATPQKKKSVFKAVLAGISDYKDTTDYGIPVTILLKPGHSGTKVSVAISARPGMQVKTILPDAYCDLIEAAANSN